MDRHRGDRSGDRFGDGSRRMPSRWSSDSTSHPHQRFPREGGGEGFNGGGGRGGGSGGRYHPYRGPQDFPPPSMEDGGVGGGFRDSGFGPSPAMGGPRRGLSGRGGSPDRGLMNKYAKLFIGSVPRTATEEDIRPVFEDHGDVIEVAFIRDRKTGEQQGCCFVKYASSEEADRAIRALHNQYTLPGGLGPIQVRYADGEKEHHGALEDKLFVASLNKQATAKEIEEIFSPYGHVEDVYIMRDSSRQSRGCGFVKFSNRETAMAALNGLNGKFVMRGCDQPLVVRFADPKRPRPGEQRGGPAFGGPGFSPRSEAALVIRPTGSLDEPKKGHKTDGWHPLSPEPLGPSSQFSTHGSGSHLTTKGGSIAAFSENSGVYASAGGLNNGSVPNLSLPTSSQGFNQLAAPGRPIPGQQTSSLQNPFMPPQSFPPPIKLQHSQQIPASNSQTLNMQAPTQQLSQLQVPQSGSLTQFNQTLSSKLPSFGGQGSMSQPLLQQNASNAALQAPLGLQAQAVPPIANQQQFSVSNVTQQLLQQPAQQFPQLPQMLLQQQAQALQSSVQSSQQAIIQLQQQLQLMQQQQQIAQAVKPQSAWTGSVPTSTNPVSTVVSTSASVIPSAPAATPSIPMNLSAAAPLTCNWTEHSSPEGFKYYYNSMTHESKWEKPEEFALFEQQQQKMLLQQQQQQKLALQQFPSSDAQSNQQVQSTPQVSQSQQVQQQMMRQQQQLQLLQPGLFQAPGGVPQQSLQDVNYAQLPTGGSVVDPARVQQGIQAAQDWAWKNKPAGS